MGSSKITGKALDDIINSTGEGYNKSELSVANTALEKLFEYYSAAIKLQLRQSLRNKKKKATGNLKDTLEVYTIQEGNNTGLEVLIEEYYKYVNDGRTGKKDNFTRDKSKLVGNPKENAKVPPFDNISKWLSNKASLKGKLIKQYGLSKRGNKLRLSQTARVGDKLKKVKIVEQIRWGIYWKGIEPTYFYTDTINQQLVNNIEADIYQLLGRTIELNISNVNNSK